MRILPRSLAGRLAALLVLTLVVAQMVTFALFTGERISAFRVAYREDVVDRLASLVALLEETEPSLHDRLAAVTSSRQFRVDLGPAPAVREDRPSAAAFRMALCEALGKTPDDVHVNFAEPPRRGWFRRLRHENQNPRDAERPPRRGPPAWLALSIRLAHGTWLNASAERPPVPPLGKAFLGSFLISAVAVAAVGAIGIRRASRPMRQLASAADRLGRGESFDPLPETGPEEPRHANVAFNRMRERLERFIRDRTTMLAAIAHDLRTPITSLRLRAEFIEDDEVKTKILETLAEMQAMTDAVLAFARGDTESEATRSTDVTALAESVVEDMAASGRDVSFKESPPATIKCRPLALKRGLNNLIENATFYGVRARVAVETGPGEVRIVVDDDGSGIPEPDLERVFEPFVRLENSRSRETGGAGLGLAIARGVFRAHGGDVRLENRMEGGLRAVASLPV